MKRKVLILSVFMLALFIFLHLAGNANCSSTELVLKPKIASDSGIIIIPESDRTMDRLVMGVIANKSKLFYIPAIDYKNKFTPEQALEIQKRLFWLTIEITHGYTLRYIPKHTKMFVGLPDGKKFRESLGNEKEFFKEYLEKRCLWSRDDIEKRVRFFHSPVELHWAQDTSKIVGKDSRGRSVIKLGACDSRDYAEAVKNLVSAYPDDFYVLPTEAGVSAEGGDEDIIWTPEGDPAILAGKNRIIRFAQVITGNNTAASGVDASLLEQAKEKFSKSFFGIRNTVLPEQVLLDPQLGNSELFHLDMIVSVIPSKKGIAAFIPQYAGNNQYDCLLNSKLDPEFVRSCNSEYNEAAKQMKDLGYRVIRLPFSDHPVRNPVNVAKYKDPDTGKYTILLPKYPSAFPVSGSRTPQKQVQEKLSILQSVVDAAMQRSGMADPRSIINAINDTEAKMNEVAGMKNPITERHEKLYSSEGITVKTVPCFMFGAGGIHCELYN